MSWPQPPPPPSSFPKPYASHGSSNTARNGAGDSALHRDGLPPNHGYPPMHNTGVSPPQLYSSPSRRSTLPTAPPHQYASSFQGQPDPSPAGSVSHYPPYPARYASIGSSNPPPSMTQRAATMPMPGHPNIAPSMPYDMSLYPPSHSEMSGGPQPSSQTWSRLDTDEGADESSGFSGGDSEQNPEGMSDLKKRSPPSLPFAGSWKSHGRRPGKPSGSPTPDQLPCRLCKKMSPRHIIERWEGFCCETHRTQWMVVHQRW